MAVNSFKRSQSVWFRSGAIVLNCLLNMHPETIRALKNGACLESFPATWD